jgi:hypothetical protein
MSVLVQVAEAQSAASGAVAGVLRELAGPATPADLPAVLDAVMASRLVQVWEVLTPEAVRDLIATAAHDAVQHGVTEVPETLRDSPATEMLDMVATTLAEDPSHPIVGPRKAGDKNPALTYASSCAFDRDDADAVTMRTFAVLFILWTIAYRAELDAKDAAASPAE